MADARRWFLGDGAMKRGKDVGPLARGFSGAAAPFPPCIPATRT